MKIKSLLASFFTALALAPSAFASYYLMQVEQVIASMDGDLSAQAIQLRMRAPAQFLVSQTRLRVWNSTGTQPLVVLDIAADVTRFTAGSRILLATPSFTKSVREFSPHFTPDFTITRPIPQAYFTAGRLTYETDQGFVLWSLAWGGGAYTGGNLGAVDNDADGNYGPAFIRSLPAHGRQGVLFNGPATAPSTSNLADYVVSANPATVTTNTGESYIIGPHPEIALMHAHMNLIDGISKKNFSTVRVGSSSSQQTFTIINVGTAKLTNLQIAKSGSSPKDFIVSKLSKTFLLPDESIKFNVTFKPRSTGLHKAIIHIKNNDSDENPFDIKLKGTGG